MKLSLECLKTAPLHLRQSSNFFIWWYARSSTFHAILILEPLWLLCRVRKCLVPLMKSSNVQFAWKQSKRGTGINSIEKHSSSMVIFSSHQSSSVWWLCPAAMPSMMLVSPPGWAKLQIVHCAGFLLNIGKWWGLCWWLRTASPRSLLDG